MIFEDIWEWMNDVGNNVSDFFSNLFEGLGGVSGTGLLFGVIGLVFLLFAGKWTLAPFLKYQGAVGKVIWSVVTYAGTFIACYFIGNHFEKT